MDSTALNLSLLQRISAPYAKGYAHVQGPGGNTSVKFDGKMMIKASGFTFSDVAEGKGYAAVNIEDVFSSGNISNKKADEIVIHCRPLNSRPSMEFQFHAILNKFVLHTHSVYADVALCSDNSADLLNDIFSRKDFLLLPYVTPGLPIAKRLLIEMKKKTLPPIIFLKNHGIIVHHDDLEEAIRIYDDVERQLKNKFALPGATDEMDRVEKSSGIEFSISKNDFEFLTNRQLTDSVLIPDQSVFFRNKVGYSENENKAVVVDAEKRTISFSGTSRFIKAGVEMLQAVLYIRKQIKRLGWTPEYLKAKDIADIHGLESEKHRISNLN